MKRIVLALAASGIAIAVASPAVAAPFINIVDGSGTFGNSSVVCADTGPCSFSDTITFTTPEGYNLTSATISSTQVGADLATNIDFSSVTLNGVTFDTVTTGIFEFRNLLNQWIVPGGSNTLVVNGTTGGRASYGGALVFTAAQAVPEPATWGLMLLGFGAMGGMLRSRRKTSARIRFA